VKTARFIAAAALLTVLATTSARADNARDMVERANRKYAQKEFAEALKLYRSAHAGRPEDKRLDYNVAGAHYKLKQYRQSLKQYERAVNAQDPELAARAAYNAGNAAFRIGRLNDAVEFYKKALRLRADNADAKVNLDLALQKLEEQKKRQREKDGKKGPEKDKKDQKKTGGKDQGKPQSRPQKRQDEKTDSQREQKKNGKQQPGESADAQNADKQNGASKGDGAPAEISREDALKLLESLARQEKNLRLRWARRSVEARGHRVEKDW